MQRLATQPLFSRKGMCHWQISLSQLPRQYLTQSVLYGIFLLSYSASGLMQYFSIKIWFPKNVIEFHFHYIQVHINKHCNIHAELSYFICNFKSNSNPAVIVAKLESRLSPFTSCNYRPDFRRISASYLGPAVLLLAC